MEKKFMQSAIKEALNRIKKHKGGPFGACIVKDGKIIAFGHNTVLKSNNPCNHAEVNAIRIAGKKLNTWNLSGCQIYSTTEPCPMCFFSIHWARIDEIIYGTEINDVAKLGFNEVKLSNKFLKKAGKLKVRIKSDFMRKECLDLLNEWKKLGGGTY